MKDTANLLFSEEPQDPYERTRKICSNLGRAIVMRILVALLLLLAFLKTMYTPWMLGILALVLLLDLGVLPILVKEWNLQRKKLRMLEEEEELS